MKRSQLGFTILGTLVGLGALGAGETNAFAAGTALDVQSARGTGMASSMTALTDDSASIFYNAAGIARGKTFDAQIGITPIIPSFKYTDPSGNETKLPFYAVTPINAYVSGGITDDLSLGVGVFTPFGLMIKWPDGFVGRNLVSRASLQTFYVNPTAAYRFGPLRIGAGLQVVRGTVELSRIIRFGGGDEGLTQLGAGAWGVGANGGVQLDLFEKYLTLGVQYRSAVKLNFDGDAHFSNIPSAFQRTLVDQPGQASLVNPDTLAMGIAARPTKNINVDVDVVWIGWGKFKSLTIEFPQDATGTLTQSTQKNWHDTVNVHGGVEGVLSDNWRVRGGVLYDPSPAPSSTLSPEIPDANRLNLAVGGSYIHDSGFRVELGYQYIVLFSKQSDNPQLLGKYGGFVNLLGLSVGFSPPETKAPPPAGYVEPPSYGPTPGPPPPESLPAEPLPAPAPPPPPPPLETKPDQPPPPPPP